MRLSVIAVLLLAALSPAYAQSAPDLGFASSFAVLGRSVSNSGSTTVLAGNAGGNTTTLSKTNFVLGDPRQNDALVQQAQRDAAAAYAALSPLDCLPLPAGPLPRGVYCVEDGTLPQSLTLDADNKPNEVWIFKVRGSLTTKPGSTVQTINEGRDNNVYWRVEGSATFGANSVFAGNVLAAGDIRVERNATVSGRLLTPGAVNLTDAGVTICCALLDMAPHVLPTRTSGMDYGATLTPKGGSGAYRFALAASDPPLSATVTEQGSLTVRQPAAGVYKLAIAVSDSTGISCIRVYRLVICGPVTLLPLPKEPEACILYNEPIVSDPTGLTFTYTGLPAELKVLKTGRLDGTPVRVQDYDFTVTASDAFGCSGSRRYTGHISSRFKLVPESGVVSEGTVLTAVGGSGTYTFTISGGAPFQLSQPGTSSSPTRVLTGTPPAGCHKFTVTVTACEVVASGEYTVVVPPVPIIFTPAGTTLPPATVCSPYRQQFSADACSGTYPFDEIAGDLPPGLTFDRATGKLCGTPEAAGMYLFTVPASDGSHTSSHDYLLEVHDLTVTIEPPLPPPAIACVYYKQQVFANCGAGNVCEFTPMCAPLPDGLCLSKTGWLTGTPTTPTKSTTFSISVGPQGCPVKKIVSLDLTVLCNVTLSPTQLPFGRLGISYKPRITASCGTPPYMFSVVSGSPPPGLTLLPDGTFFGTPALVGCFNFRVRATDSANPACFGEQDYQICIVPVTFNAPALSGWGMGAMTAFVLLVGLLTLRRLYG